MDLLSETIRLVRASGRPVSEICKAADVTPRWFYMVESGEIADPSIVRIQRLYNYLKQHEAAA